MTEEKFMGIKTISEQLFAKNYPFELYDKHGNIVYYEESSGFWIKNQYSDCGLWREYTEHNAIKTKEYWEKSWKENKPK
tara:strand:+ start:942 stop:1178 length:237 start_codon:yes stop_codon:yes gene_type:complete